MRRLVFGYFLACTVLLGCSGSNGFPESASAGGTSAGHSAGTSGTGSSEDTQSEGGSSVGGSSGSIPASIAVAGASSGMVGRAGNSSGGTLTAGGNASSGAASAGRTTLGSGGTPSRTLSETTERAPACGDGSVDWLEDCDDGNQIDGDSCPSNCLAFCGDGVVMGSEACDDGNALAGDGCNHCQKPGTLAWSNTSDRCQGRIHVSPTGLISMVCSSSNSEMMQRYTMSGELVEAVPFLPADTNEGLIYVIDVVERGDAMYVAMVVNRTSDVNAVAYQPRTRIAKFDANRNLVWQRDLTPFPGGAQETPKGIAVSPSGQVAVVGDSRARIDAMGELYVALLGTGGQVIWKKGSTVDAPFAWGGVLIADTGEVLVAKRSNYDSQRNAFTTARLALHDTTGTVAWERPLGAEANLNRGTVLHSMTMGTDGTVRTLYVDYVEDPLVPTPPRTTASIREAQLALRTGEFQWDRLVKSTVTERATWTAQAASTSLVFAVEAPYLACQWNQGTAISGLSDAGLAPWTIPLESGTKWLTTLFAYKYLVCASYTTASTWGITHCYYTN